MSPFVLHRPARSEAEIAPTQLDVDVTQAQPWWVVVEGGPSTKTHSKLLNVQVSEGKKVGATPSDQSLFGSDASFQCFLRWKPKTFLQLSRSPRNKCGRKGLSKTWSLRVLMTEKRGKRGKWINSIVIVIIDYGLLPILIVAIAFMVLYSAFDGLLCWPATMYISWGLTLGHLWSQPFPSVKVSSWV